MRLSPTTTDTSPTTEEVRTGTTVVLDTSVLLSDPESVFAFPTDDVVLPMTVIEELDNHKSRKDDVGHAARQVGRLLEELRLRAGGEDLQSPVPLPAGGTLRIVINGHKLEKIRALGLSEEKADNRILAAALGLSESGPVRVVSADVNLRLKAAALGLEASEYAQTSGREHNEKHPGWRTLGASAALVDQVHAQKQVPSAEWSEYDTSELSGLKTNEFGVLQTGTGQSALVRRTASGIRLVPRELAAWGLRARSKEQHFALDLLLDPHIAAVGLSGRAGSGKTLVSLAAALEQTFKKGVYDRVMILRPVVPVGGQDIGFLPGTVEEKLGPWMEAITDAMVALGDEVTYAKAKDTIDGWVQAGKLTLEPVTYLRGRSLQRTFVLVDEAQNLEPLTLKTILTRVGEGFKVVLVGDVSQIDNPWSSERSNAISVLADRFTGRELFGHLVLTKGERSPLADLAAELL